MEKNIPCEWKSKESWNSYTAILISDNIDFKDYNKRKKKDITYW